MSAGVNSKRLLPPAPDLHGQQMRVAETVLALRVLTGSVQRTITRKSAVKIADLQEVDFDCALHFADRLQVPVFFAVRHGEALKREKIAQSQIDLATFKPVLSHC